MKMSDKMDMDLIMSIVVLNNAAFKNATKTDIGNIMLISKDCGELSKLNINIQQQQNKFYVEYMHDKLRQNLQALADAQPTHEILAEVYSATEELQLCFINLMIAEYKELVYGNLYDPAFEYTSYQLLLQYENILYADDILYDMLYKHEHNPVHYMYYTDCKAYMFYELLERKGYYILDMWESGEH